MRGNPASSRGAFADNILSPPSEPEITRTLDAKAEVLDAGSPSDPHSGPQSWRQHLDIAAEKRDVAEIRKALKDVPGIETVIGGRGTVRVTFDSRRVTAGRHRRPADARRQEA